MRIALSLVLSGTALFLECYALGQPTTLLGTNSYDLEVTVNHPGSRELSMLITIGTEEPFKLSATTGRQQAEIAGVVHLEQGKFLLDFTLSGPGGTSAASGYPLELGKAVGYKSYGGVVYRRVTFKLQKHEARFGSLTPTFSPNHPTAATRFRGNVQATLELRSGTVRPKSPTTMYYHLRTIAEPGASPNGGPAERFGNSGAHGEPPSA